MDLRHQTLATDCQTETRGDQDHSNLNAVCDRYVAAGGEAGAIATEIKSISAKLDEASERVREFLAR